MNTYDLSKILRTNSMLACEFYIDIYKPLKLECVISVARFYLGLQIEENRSRKLNKKFNRFEDTLDENLSPKEIQLLSLSMVEMHMIASDHYLNVYTRNRNFNNKWRLFQPKPFTISMFRQVSSYFLVYMKRIKEQETIKIEKFERAFRKIDEVGEKLKGYDKERDEMNRKLSRLGNLLKAWDEKIEKQKDTYRVAVDECKKEEKLVDEMNLALEKLKNDVNYIVVFLCQYKLT
jgi:hypothetical protein